MDLSRRDKERLSKLRKRSSSKARLVLRTTMFGFSVALLVYFLIVLVMGGIRLKEFLWIAFFYVVFLIGFMVLYALEKDLTFLLRLMDKKSTEEEKGDIHSTDSPEIDKEE